MGSKPSREDKAMSPLSSWGGSFDDLLCGEGKVCGDQWTPIPSREGSFNLEELERRRSAATLRGAHYEDYDDDFEVIRQQPLPMDVFSMRAPADVDRYTMPKRIRRRRSVYENNRTPVIGGRPKRKRKKKRVIRSVKKKNSRHGSRTTTRLSGPLGSVRLHRKMNPILLRSMSESRVTPAPVYVRSTQIKRVAPTTTRIKKVPVVSRRANSENSSSILTKIRVVPPRNLRTQEVQPPQPFRFRHLPDQPYLRLPTASHPLLR